MYGYDKTMRKRRSNPYKQITAELKRIERRKLLALRAAEKEAKRRSDNDMTSEL